MESAQQFSFRIDCNNTAEVPSISLRTALSAIPFVSDLCGVDVQWFQERSSKALPNSTELWVWMTLSFLSGSKNFCKLLCVSCEVFDLHGYDWIHWVAKSCTIAYRWLLVSRFTIFTENLVICCYQVTKIFCSRYGSAIASSARDPCNFRPLTDLAISVSREVSINTVLTQILTSLGCGL